MKQSVTLLDQLMRLAQLTIVAAVCVAGSMGAQAAEVSGNVKTNVKAGFILQSNKGIANRSEINLGSVTGKHTKVGGNFKSRVRVGAVIQSNLGIANKAKINIGSVTD